MGALLVLATIVILFGSYLLQYRSLDGWSLYVERFQRCEPRPLF